MDLSIIVVSWNTRDLLGRCLDSIFAFPFAGEFEVWVVDNASHDGSVALVQEKFPHVHLVKNEENVGFAQANNQAIDLSTGRYVLLLNPDTEVRPNALDALVRFMDEQPEAGAAGSRLLNTDGTLQPSCYPAMTLGREFWRLLHLDALRPLGSYRMQEWDRQRPREVDVLKGASILLRRSVLRRVGSLDAGYFMYTEEVDLCYRLQQAGWRLYWVPDSEVVHYGGQSTRQVAAEMFLHLYKSKIQFFRKHYGGAAACAYKWILTMASLARLSLGPLIWLEPASKRKDHLSLLRNYVDLLRMMPDM